jgi:hypothetical protein
MKEHVPTFAALTALAMVLAFCAYLVSVGIKVEGIVGLGIAGSIGALVSGFAPSFSQQRGTSQTINAATANTSNEVQPAPAAPKENA